jgi:outer membrane immunogenic protein
MRALAVAVFAVISAVAAQPAIAADIAKAAPPTPIWSWSGFYLGANIGGSWGRSDTTFVLSDTPTGVVRNATASRFDMNGVIGGGQLGYNWQTAPWVFGLEADIQGSGQRGNGASVCAGATGIAPPLSALSSTCLPGHVGDTRNFDTPAGAVTTTLSQRLDWFGTVRARAGFTVTPTLIAYATGGLTYGQIASSLAINGVNITGGQGTNTVVLTPVSAAFSNSTINTGWTIGAGVEGVIFGNWTGKIEYLYMDLGHVSGSVVTPLVSVSGATLTSSFNSHITDNIIRVGLNYKFAN